MGGRSELCKGGLKLPAGSKYITVCKCAPNYILEACKGYVSENGDELPMTEATKKDHYAVIDEYSSQALRVLAIAVNTIAELPFDSSDEDLSTDAKFSACQKDLMLVGLVASIDPDRNGVKESVELARGAGIRVVMITGDYLKTASAIARNVHILQDQEADAAVDCTCLRPEGAYFA